MSEINKHKPLTIYTDTPEAAGCSVQVVQYNPWYRASSVLVPVPDGQIQTDKTFISGALATITIDNKDTTVSTTGWSKDNDNTDKNVWTVDELDTSVAILITTTGTPSIP